MYYLSEALHQNNSQSKWHFGLHCIFLACSEKPLFLLSVSEGLTGQPFSSKASSQAVYAVIHKASDCTWAPIQTTCHGKIFTPHFRHYSHTTMPLVDREPSWAERRVISFTSSVPEKRMNRQRQRCGKYIALELHIMKLHMDYMESILLLQHILPTQCMFPLLSVIWCHVVLNMDT